MRFLSRTLDISLEYLCRHEQTTVASCCLDRLPKFLPKNAHKVARRKNTIMIPKTYFQCAGFNEIMNCRINTSHCLSYQYMSAFIYPVGRLQCLLHTSQNTSITIGVGEKGSVEIHSLLTPHAHHFVILSSG